MARTCRGSFFAEGWAVAVVTVPRFLSRVFPYVVLE
jgi:hypothetical protein